MAFFFRLSFRTGSILASHSRFTHDDPNQIARREHIIPGWDWEWSIWLSLFLFSPTLFRVEFTFWWFLGSSGSFSPSE